MKVFSVGWQALLIISSGVYAATPIKSVTVFKGRASVEREFIGKLAAREQSISFNQLPTTLDTDSLKVEVDDGKGVEVLGIRHRRVYLRSYQSDQLNKLVEQRKKLTTQRQQVLERGRELHRQHRHIKDIRHYYRESFTININSNQWRGGEFEKFVKFLRKRGGKLYQSWNKLFQHFLKLNEQLEMVNAKISELGGGKDKAYLNVEVDLTVKKARQHRIRLSYLVNGASWTPIYDIRIKGSKAWVEQSALVDQNSGEDWNGCQLFLSNNRARLNTTPPKISPDRLRYRVVKKVKTSVKSKNIDNVALNEVAKLAVEQDVVPDSKGDEEVITRVFAIKGKQTVLDGTKKLKLLIAKKSSPYRDELEVIAPKHPKAYRRGDITNPFDWSLAPGKANIFYQGSYIQQTRIDLTPRKKSFHINGGIDHGIWFRRSIHSSQKEDGMINKEVIYRREIMATLTNYTDRSKKIKILEQVPISELDSVKIKVEGDGKSFKPLEGYPSWHYRDIILKANQTKSIKFVLTARTPVGTGFSW